MSHSDEAMRIASLTAQALRIVREKVIRIGIDDNETLDAILSGLGTAEAAALRWYLDLGQEKGIIQMPAVEDWEPDELD